MHGNAPPSLGISLWNSHTLWKVLGALSPTHASHKHVQHCFFFCVVVSTSVVKAVHTHCTGCTACRLNCRVEKLWAALMGMWGEPVLPPDDGLASLEAREATASSNLHQLDLRLRHAMAGAVAQLRGCGGEGAGRGAQLLSEARRSLLGRARAQLGKGVAVVDAVESAEVAFAETCAAILTHDAH